MQLNAKYAVVIIIFSTGTTTHTHTGTTHKFILLPGMSERDTYNLVYAALARRRKINRLTRKRFTFPPLRG